MAAQGSDVLYSAVQCTCSAVMCSKVQQRAVQSSAVQCSAVQCSVRAAVAKQSGRLPPSHKYMTAPDSSRAGLPVYGMTVNI